MESTAGSLRTHGPRNPGFFYGALSVAILAVLALVSLTARQTPPPTVAEFAPQALEQITDAPLDQSSDFGSGPGSGGAAALAEKERLEQERKREEEAIDVPRVRRCVGNPPRQIEDPQSPPCVPYWAGDNGGKTWRGVTKDEIKVVLPTCESTRKRIYDALFQFFNRRFEFYGRRMRLLCGQDGNGAANETQQKAEARGDFEEFKPFVAGRYFSGIGTAYSDEIARLGVVSITNAIQNLDSLYKWSYWMEAGEMFRNLSEWACGRLVGGKAVHAGDDALKTKTRKFGIIIETGYDVDNTSIEPLRRGIERCGGVVADTSENEFEDRQGDFHLHVTIMLRMKQAGVTSVFCFCHLFRFGPFQVAASNQAYFPEWLVSTYGFADLNSFIKLGGNPPEQMENTFGVTFQPRQVPLASEPWWWAVKEVDPTYDTEDQGTTVAAGAGMYRPILMIASGIQMAGPNLTPQTFEQGLQRAIFPNPPHPNLPGHLGFPRTHGGMRDGAEIWWSNSAAPPFTTDGPGTYCYVEGGVRHSLGNWPKGGDPFFNSPCL